MEDPDKKPDPESSDEADGAEEPKLTAEDLEVQPDDSEKIKGGGNPMRFYGH
jgi:hypothetical protein